VEMIITCNSKSFLTMIFTISRAADSREPVGLLSVPRDYSLSYSIQFPTYADLCQRYAVTGINSTIHDFLVYRNDSSFTPSSSTHPRTERRTLPDFTLGSGLLQFQADFMTSCNFFCSYFPSETWRTNSQSW